MGPLRGGHRGNVSTYPYPLRSLDDYRGQLQALCPGQSSRRTASSASNAVVLGITRWKQTAHSRYVPRFDLETVSPTATTHWASASVSERPAVLQSLLNQLIVGGRMIIPVGETRQPPVIIRRTKDGRRTRKLSARRLCSDDGITLHPTSLRKASYQLLSSSSQYLFKLSASEKDFFTEASSETGSW